MFCKLAYVVCDLLNASKTSCTFLTTKQHCRTAELITIALELFL